MKVYIGVDSEGEACVVGQPGVAGETGPWQFEYCRRRATEEASAAVEGARKAGATEIVVHDQGFMRGYAPGGTIMHYDLLPRGIRIAQGAIPIQKVVDKTFDAAMLVGFHARAGVPTGVMAHTFSMVSIEKIEMNGREIGEIGIESLIIGAFGVPVVMVAGDEDATNEAREWLGDIEVAPVKKGFGYHQAISLHPADANELIRVKAERALQRLREFKPFKLSPPYEMKITTRSEEGAEMRVKRHNGERIGPRTVLKRTNDPMELW